MVVVAWDVDWTLIEPSGEPWAACYEAAARACGAIPGRVDFHGRTDASILAEMVGAHAVGEALKVFTQAWLELCPTPACRPLPGVVNLLRSFSERQVVNVLLTGNVRARAAAKLAAAGLDGWFDWDVSRFGDLSVDRSVLVRQMVASTASPVVVVGDTPRDIEAARAGGAAAVVGVATGVFSVPDLLGADVVVPNLAAGGVDVDMLVESFRRRPSESASSSASLS